jgi:Trp operon repressor
MDKLLAMSTKELNRLEVMQRLAKKQMSQKEAGRMLGLSVRQIKRVLRAYREREPRDWSPNMVDGKRIIV